MDMNLIRASAETIVKTDELVNKNNEIIRILENAMNKEIRLDEESIIELGSLSLQCEYGLSDILESFEFTKRNMDKLQKGSVEHNVVRILLERDQELIKSYRKIIQICEKYTDMKSL